jgi:hypothetical protein
MPPCTSPAKAPECQLLTGALTQIDNISSELQSQAIVINTIFIIMYPYYAQIFALLLLSLAAVEGSLRGAHGSDSGSQHGKIHFTNGSTKKRRLRSA